MAEVAASSTKSKSQASVKPEKPDEEQYKKDVEKAQKELDKAQERLVRLLSDISVLCFKIVQSLTIN